MMFSQDMASLCTLGAGATFTEAVLTGKPHPVTVITNEACTLLRVRREEFHELWSASSNLLMDIVTPLSTEVLASGSRIFHHHPSPSPNRSRVLPATPQSRPSSRTSTASDVGARSASAPVPHHFNQLPKNNNNNNVNSDPPSQPPPVASLQKQLSSASQRPPPPTSQPATVSSSPRPKTTNIMSGAIPKMRISQAQPSVDSQCSLDDEQGAEDEEEDEDVPNPVSEV